MEQFFETGNYESYLPVLNILTNKNQVSQEAK